MQSLYIDTLMHFVAPKMAILILACSTKLLIGSIYTVTCMWPAIRGSTRHVKTIFNILTVPVICF